MQLATQTKPKSVCQAFTGALIVTGLTLHVGSAILRLNTFVPYPRLVDYGSFYIGARLLSTGQNPYLWENGIARSLLEQWQLGSTPPISTPPWLWMLVPWTTIVFPLSAVLWLALLLTVTLISVTLLARIAGYRSWKAVAIVFGVVVTFGPTFLNLTLGQNGLFLLLALLVLGEALRDPRPRMVGAAVVLWAAAISAKLFPILWVFPVALMHRWRMLFALMVFTLVIFVLAYVLAPEASQTYWLDFLIDRTSEYSGEASLDDQSLGAWLDRLGRDRSISTSVISFEEIGTTEWHAPWKIATKDIKLMSTLFLVLLFAVVVSVIWKVADREPAPSVYLWSLLCILAVPHMERYNLVLVLPAMAWLWTRGDRMRLYVAFVYFLVGLTRLTHFFALSLPAPWGPIATGFGTLAALILIAAIAYELINPRAMNLIAESQTISR